MVQAEGRPSRWGRRWAATGSATAGGHWGAPAFPTLRTPARAADGGRRRQKSTPAPSLLLRNGAPVQDAGPQAGPPGPRGGCPSAAAAAPAAAGVAEARG